MLILGRVQYFNLPYFARKRLKFRRSPKDGQLYHPGGDRRKRDENSMRRGGGKVRLKRVGNREREDKKGKRVNR